MSDEDFVIDDDPIIIDPPTGGIVASSLCIDLPQRPNMFALTASDNREIVRITHDGKVIVNPEFTVDEAAKAFWDAVRQFVEGFA